MSEKHSPGKAVAEPHVAQYDWTRFESVSMAVIRAVAAFRGVSPTDLHPLNDVVDPDALDAVFERPSDGATRADKRVAFPFNGCEVTVDSDGRVLVSG